MLPGWTDFGMDEPEESEEMAHDVVAGHQAEEKLVKDKRAKVLVDELLFHLKKYWNVLFIFWNVVWEIVVNLIHSI